MKGIRLSKTSLLSYTPLMALCRDLGQQSLPVYTQTIRLLTAEYKLVKKDTNLILAVFVINQCGEFKYQIRQTNISIHQTNNSICE